MKAATAIRILESDRDSIDSVNSDNCEMWLIKAVSNIEDIFGKDTPQLKFISKFEFMVDALPTIARQEGAPIWYTFNEQGKPRLKEFYTTCIETIQRKESHRLLENELPLQNPTKYIIHKIKNILQKTGRWIVKRIVEIIVGLIITVGVFKIRVSIFHIFNKLFLCGILYGILSKLILK